LCEWRDSKKVAKVIDRSSSTSLEGVVTRRYYIHYLCFNRRMDEWVSEHKLVPYHDALTSAEQEDNDNVNGDGEPSLKKRKGGGEGNQYGVGEGETIHLIEPGHDEHEGMDEASIKEHEEVTKIKNINKIEIGRYIMDTWYFSPFPKEYYPDGVTDMMYFCEFCLKYYIHRAELTRHSSRCNLRHPPGNEIYRDGNIAMFEVDGGGSDKQHEYSQNLCYIAKLFLDHKTLYFDVDPFLFYVLCEISEKGYHLVGYYSKEKYSEQGFNLACILTLPCYQRKGYGSFLIDFSYMLSRKEEKIGSPEKPLSDLGLVSYRSYWCNRIMDLLEGLDKRRSEVSVWDICKMTSFMPDDVTSTLKFLNLIKYNNGLHCLVISPESMKFALTKFKRVLKQRTADIRKLHWTPLRLEAIKVDKWSIATYEQSQSEADTAGQ
jgi:histone acetyltransferase MYST1